MNDWAGGYLGLGLGLTQISEAQNFLSVVCFSLSQYFFIHFAEKNNILRDTIAGKETLSEAVFSVLKPD